ncbi:unnamed protein product [Paramecium pentaurelia]|uniref:Macro domain-containing protein n=1 Tax=Paramecium pentaurelia TaxID=43138 RepID=A0A8S1WZE1_9CILI|nr:unnamed protein product [Paramecium pentaurelia]
MGNKSICCSTQAEFQSQICRLDGRPQAQIIQQTDVNGCRVVLSLGKLFNELVDIIVLPTTQKLKLNYQASEHIKKFASDQILNELHQILLSQGGKVQLGSVVHTHAGEMPYDYLFFTVLPSSTDASIIVLNESYEQEMVCSLEENFRVNSITAYAEKRKLDSTQSREIQIVYEAVVNCLEKATELGAKSIAFSLMDQQINQIARSKLASVMLFAIKSFLREYGSKTTLIEIRISSCEAPQFKIYKTYMNQILNDQGETTIEKLFQQEEQIYQQEFKIDSQTEIKRDDIRKFCNGYKEGNQKTKEFKSSF